MFLGHFGVGFGAKRLAPRASLGTLFLAAQFVDLLWPLLLLLGVERVAIEPGITRVTPLDFVSYPVSHSLVLDVAWALLVGGVYWLLRRYAAGALVLAACVVSHWALDLIVHRPDLPIAPGVATRVGLGLWWSLPGTLIVESLVFGAGVLLYARATRARDRAGSYGLWALVVFLAIVYAANLFGPPPPSVPAIAWAGQAQWLIVVLGFWVDHHRIARVA